MDQVVITVGAIAPSPSPPPASPVQPTAPPSSSLPGIPQYVEIDAGSVEVAGGAAGLEVGGGGKKQSRRYVEKSIFRVIGLSYRELVRYI